MRDDPAVGILLGMLLSLPFWFGLGWLIAWWLR